MKNEKEVFVALKTLQKAMNLAFMDDVIFLLENGIIKLYDDCSISTERYGALMSLITDFKAIV